MDETNLRLIPLGGLGEFGLNAMVVEWQGHLLLVDAGVMFPGPDLPGVDSVVPDFQYLAERRDRLAGIVLTHGHEDHIGALAYALQAAPAPVWGSRLTVGFARRRLQERGLAADFRTLAPGHVFEAGPFRIHPIAVAHSVVDSMALAIETPAGVVLHTGDFKMDAAGGEGQQTDVAALAAWGGRGVLVLLSDSTNVEMRGRTGGEDDVVPAFEDVFARTPGRVVVTCFATSVPRMQRVSALAERRGRSVGFVGRRMVDNAEVAMELGLLRVASLARGPDPAPGASAWFVSGSQGEPFSALSLLSLGEHRELSVGPGDTVVFSARPIPGNERAVSRVIGNLYRRGCDVVHPGTAHVHVSGHASRDELAEMLRLVRPRYFVPVHGEYRMLAQHARLAVEAGLPADAVFVLEDGEALAAGAQGARKAERVAAGRVLLDRLGEDALEDVVVRDRRHLSAEGVVVPVMVMDKQSGDTVSPPEIVSRGFVGEERPELVEEMRRVVLETLAARPPEERQEPALTRERVRQDLRRFLRRKLERRPMVIPVVIEV